MLWSNDFLVPNESRCDPSDLEKYFLDETCSTQILRCHIITTQTRLQQHIIHDIHLCHYLSDARRRSKSRLHGISDLPSCLRTQVKRASLNGTSALSSFVRTQLSRHKVTRSLRPLDSLVDISGLVDGAKQSAPQDLAYTKSPPKNLRFSPHPHANVFEGDLHRSL